MIQQSIPDAVFFDLDGTLVDSAPDMIVAMRRLLVEQGGSVAGAAGIATVVSKGGRAMVRRGFPDADENRVEALLPRFLELYAGAIAEKSALFPGMDTVLGRLESRAVPWGIVTNKPGHLARALLASLQLDSRCAALVSGDCLPEKKPDPAPILRACEIAGVAAANCIYVGDDLRDIEAGHRAGMRTFAAGWGYLDGEDPRAWGADRVIDAPANLLAAFGLDER
ncbi:MAG: phosphoglycolate phosphatase [Proteobacteria bacterium]|nr:phosphoglycolate phosphatase [Pseudomonadota bacterium]